MPCDDNSNRPSNDTIPAAYPVGMIIGVQPNTTGGPRLFACVPNKSVSTTPELVITDPEQDYL